MDALKQHHTNEPRSLFYKQKWELLQIAALQLFKNKDHRESQVSHNSWMLDINQQHHTAV